MSEYPNSGALFKNDRKEKATHPDYTGSAEVDGVAYWISAWVKTGKSRKKFFSLSFRPKDEARQDRGEPAASLADDLDDEIPF